MNSSQLDLYLERTGYRGPRTPSLEVLHALTAAHTQTIPFENLDVLLGHRIDLGFDDLFHVKPAVPEIPGSCGLSARRWCGILSGQTMNELLTTAEIRVGVIGFGYAAETFHAPLLRATEGFRITAVASRRRAMLANALPGSP